MLFIPNANCINYVRLVCMLQYATDYKMVAVGNDTNGTALYQKVSAQHTSGVQSQTMCGKNRVNLLFTLRSVHTTVSHGCKLTK